MDDETGVFHVKQRENSPKWPLIFLATVLGYWIAVMATIGDHSPLARLVDVVCPLDMPAFPSIPAALPVERP
jgi:hypothetical protein